MSVNAGEILHLAGQNVIDRIQSAGLGNVELPVETIREVGNREVVDKVPGEPDFTFSLESLNTSVEVMAWITGGEGASAASGEGAGASDPDGTEYKWLDCGFVNIPSPWKEADAEPYGAIEAGHLIPGYYPTRISYNFGATDNAGQTLELSGGSYFYAKFAPLEQQEVGDGNETDFVTDENAMPYREGGEGGTTFRNIFGVIVDGQLQTEGIDFTVTGGEGAPATVAFASAPESGADIRFCYFTDAEQSFPQAVHASTIVLPGAVRGRNIQVLIDGTRIGGIQTATLEATVEGQAERELGTEDIVGWTVNGTDCSGALTIRAKDKAQFFNDLQRVTGVAQDEVYGWFNNKEVDLQIKIENPKNPGQILKTLRVTDAKFQPPGTPAQVNSATDFVFSYESTNGSFSEFKGEPA